MPHPPTRVEQVLEPPLRWLQLLWGSAEVYLFYIDEAGQPRSVPHRHSKTEPAFVIGGLILPATKIPSFTDAFLKLKKEKFPGLRAKGSHHLDWILTEVKGTDLKREVRGSRDERRHALGFLLRTLRILAEHEAKILARIYCKRIGRTISPNSLYTSAVQHLCRNFHNFLEWRNSDGLAVADHRDPHPNERVAHSVFTQKYRSTGIHLPRLLETPIFAQSNNHAGIQAADIIMSAILAPIANRAYCAGRVESVHVDPKYDHIWRKLGPLLMDLRYCYRDETGRTFGGITVTGNPTGTKPGDIANPPDN